jgi:hypothetical protein
LDPIVATGDPGGTIENFKINNGPGAFYRGILIRGIKK